MGILSIDLGKIKSLACVYQAENGNHKFSCFQTNPEDIYNLMVENSPDRVVIEICLIADWVSDIVRDLGIELQVANTNHEAWRWRHVKRKRTRRTQKAGVRDKLEKPVFGPAFLWGKKVKPFLVQLTSYRIEVKTLASGFADSSIVVVYYGKGRLPARAWRFAETKRRTSALRAGKLIIPQGIGC